MENPWSLKAVKIVDVCVRSPPPLVTIDAVARDPFSVTGGGVGFVPSRAASMAETGGWLHTVAARKVYAGPNHTCYKVYVPFLREVPLGDGHKNVFLLFVTCLL